MNGNLIKELIATKVEAALRDEFKSLMNASRRNRVDIKLCPELSNAENGFNEFRRIAKEKGFKLGEQWGLREPRFVNGAQYVDANSLIFTTPQKVKRLYSRQEIDNCQYSAFGVTLSLRGWSLAFDIPMYQLDGVLLDGQTMETIAESLDCGTLVVNDVEMLETNALKLAGVRLSWFRKRQYDEEKRLRRTLKRDEKQRLFEKLTTEGAEFKANGYLEMFGAGWMRIARCDFERIKSASKTRGVDVASLLHDFANSL